MFFNKTVFDEWKQNAKSGDYRHFDSCLSPSHFFSKIDSGNKIACHPFFPLIKKRIRQRKISITQASGPSGHNQKARDICACSHVDRLIYSFYAKLLNDAYNDYAADLGFSDDILAYRTGTTWQGKNNIDFAKEVFEFLSAQSTALVMVADITKFFDNIEHEYLKNQLLKLLRVNRLDDDIYAVFKSITKYSFVESDAIKLFLDKEKNQTHTCKHRLLSAEQFKLFRQNNIKSNPNAYGIPQGVPISPVLANIYMNRLDLQLHNLAQRNAGMYRRYCDDMVLVLPNLSLADVERISNEVVAEISKVGVHHKILLQPRKTRWYLFNREKKTVEVEPNAAYSAIINYLGFSFDGFALRIRASTVGRYYSRVYRKIKMLLKQRSQRKRRSTRELFRLYSSLTSKKSNNRRKINFFTYIEAVKKKIAGTNLTFSEKVYSRHLHKIRKRLRE